MHDPIINSPEAQSKTRKYAYNTITLVFWAVYVYLWLPFASLLAWLFGFGFFYEHMIRLGGYHAFLQSISNYASIILSFAFLYIAWAQYNYRRFRNVERRHHAEKLTTKDQAEYYHLDEEKLRQCKKMKHLVINHDKDGNPESVSLIEKDTMECKVNDQLYYEIMHS